MKTKLFTFMLLAAFGVALAYCGKSPTDTVSADQAASEMKGYGEKICAKMTECFQAQLQSMPAEQREMASRMFPSGDVCVSKFTESMASVEDSAPANAEDVRLPTRAELDAAKKCMDEMVATSCTDMMSGNMPASCKALEQ
jgi:hypothetical protein